MAQLVLNNVVLADRIEVNGEPDEIVKMSQSLGLDRRAGADGAETPKPHDPVEPARVPPMKDDKPKPGRRSRKAKKDEPEPAPAPTLTVVGDEPEAPEATDKPSSGAKGKVDPAQFVDKRRLSQVVELLQELGYQDEEEIIALCEDMKGEVPVLGRIKDIAPRVRSVIEMLAS